MQRQLRAMKDQWWENKAKELQAFTICNNSRSFYEAIKVMYGPFKQSTSQLLSKNSASFLTEKSEHLEEMAGTLLWAAEQTRNHHHISTRQSAPSIHSVQARCSPSLDEVIIAIKELKPRKAPGPDGIAAKIYQYGGDTLISCIHKLFIKLWEAAELPQDLKAASIMTIYKNKGDIRDCNNYHGISLL